MGAITNARKQLIAKTAQMFLEKHLDEVLSSTVWWAENMHTSLDEALQNVCFAQMMERGEGDRLLRRAFGELPFLDSAEEIVQEFGWDKAVALAKKRCIFDVDNPEATKNISAVIIYENLPEIHQIAKYVAKEIKKGTEWKDLVKESKTEGA